MASFTFSPTRPYFFRKAAPRDGPRQLGVSREIMRNNKINPGKNPVNDQTGAPAERRSLTISGAVQGVGFRPFLWRLAGEFGVAGFARNVSEGVRAEIQASPSVLDEFERRLRVSAPTLANITDIFREIIPVIDENDFKILPSEGGEKTKILVSPDIAVCENCLADIRDPANRRFNHPFANCTDCGPRYSITRSLPYDRISTSVGCFPLCANCAREYANPADRRFHAQPIACPDCGPRLWFVANADPSEPSPENVKNALQKTTDAILAGKIVAIKGLGGFQLVCDARNDKAVALLRARKRRPHKALAVMTASARDAELFCEINAKNKAALCGKRKPIVLCPKKADAKKPLSPMVAPDAESIGIMTPYTPLHALLFDKLSEAVERPALIVTSGNAAGEPICLGNREAREKLSDLADAWLFHDRDILCRVDDSVVNGSGRQTVLRRARGYAPEATTLKNNYSGVLGVGAELKHTFCLSRDDRAFVSQHIGDLKSPANLEFFEETLKHLSGLLETRPKFLVRDLHPDYLSSRFAEQYAARESLPILALQHHAAHAAAVLAENGVYEPALALCLDGSGLGGDGTIQGGEIIYMNLAEPAWRRVGGLETFPLPGGEAAIREPWRIACGLGFPPPKKKVWARRVGELVAKNINTPQTSSCGRLFDAVSAILGLCQAITYEGQAAIRLESAALRASKNNPSLRLFSAPTPLANPLKIPARDICERVFDLKREGTSVGEIAYAFHEELAERLADAARAAADLTGTDKVGISGGVAQNSLLVSLLENKLRLRKLIPLFHKVIPPGDGGLSLGQVAWGQAVALQSGS